MSTFAAVDLDAVLDDFEDKVLAGPEAGGGAAGSVAGKGAAEWSPVAPSAPRVESPGPDEREAPQGSTEGDDKGDEGREALTEVQVLVDIDNGPEESCNPVTTTVITESLVEIEETAVSHEGGAVEEAVDPKPTDANRQVSGDAGTEELCDHQQEAEALEGTSDREVADVEANGVEAVEPIAVDLLGRESQDRAPSPPFVSIYDEGPATGDGDVEEVAATPSMVATAPDQGGLDNPPPYSELDPMAQSLAAVTVSDEPRVEEDAACNGAEDEYLRHEDTSQDGSLVAVDVRASLQDDLADLGIGDQVSPPAPAAPPSAGQSPLGTVRPTWVPDADAPLCMLCQAKFTLVKRRHHCRACGKVLCGNCCSEKAILAFLENKVARVCGPCKQELDRMGVTQEGATGGSTGAPATVARTGVLKRLSITSSGGGSDAGGAAAVAAVSSPGAGAAGVASPSSEAKQVMFSDGIKPGGDLTDLDGSEERSAAASAASSSSRRHHRRHRRHHYGRNTANVGLSLIPIEEGLLPPLAQSDDATPGPDAETAEDIGKWVVGQAKEATFQINKNLVVRVKLVKFEEDLWRYMSEGLCTVGQDEIAVLLVRLPGEDMPHKDMLEHFQHVYEQAKSGCPVVELGYFPLSPGRPFLGSSGDLGGLLYFRPSFQSLDGLDLSPSAPLPLFGVLLKRWEMPWARVFPLRLKLRLGAEFRYYPAPLWSDRNRRPVYGETGNTIMKLLCDFRNFTYSIPLIRGMVIHMEFGLTTISIPKDQYRPIQKALLNSNEPVLALGASFSSAADSHLVAVQRCLDPDDGVTGSSSGGGGGGAGASDYETQAINIANKTREVTGASFVVFNGALRQSSGLSAKSSIVEDGIMVQVTQERMLEVRKNLEKMIDFSIPCGPAERAETSPDERVLVRWVDGNRALNAGVTSMIDGSSLEGVPSIRLHSGRDYVDERNSIFVRWTEVFLLSHMEDASDVSAVGGGMASLVDPPDPMTAATLVARAVAQASVAMAAKMKTVDGINAFAVRVTLHPENAHYEAGSGGCAMDAKSPEAMNMLDSALVPVVHGPDLAGRRLAMELTFHILPC